MLTTAPFMKASGQVLAGLSTGAGPADVRKVAEERKAPHSNVYTGSGSERRLAGGASCSGEHRGLCTLLPCHAGGPWENAAWEHCVHARVWTLALLLFSDCTLKAARALHCKR